MSGRDAGGNEAQEPGVGQPGTGSARGYVRCDASADRLSHRVKEAHVLRESEQNHHRRRCEAFPGSSHGQLRVMLRSSPSGGCSVVVQVLCLAALCVSVKLGVNKGFWLCSQHHPADG